MKIDRLYAVVITTPDYERVDFITDNLDEAERDARLSPVRRQVVMLDLAKLVKLCAVEER